MSFSLTSPPLARALADRNYSDPTPVQSAVIEDAARGRDLYDGIVAAGTIRTRAEAKVAMLGAMYGATTGESGRLVPALRRAYPRAMGLVDAAAPTPPTQGSQP